MFCPECRSEYVEGVTACVDCGCPLVPTLPPIETRASRTEPVITVFEACDEAQVLLARSLLEDAGISYLTKNDRLQDLFGAGRIGGFNHIVGPVTFQVLASQADAAREILFELRAEEREDG